LSVLDSIVVRISHDEEVFKRTVDITKLSIVPLSIFLPSVWHRNIANHLEVRDHGLVVLIGCRLLLVDHLWLEQFGCVSLEHLALFVPYFFHFDGGLSFGQGTVGSIEIVQAIPVIGVKAASNFFGYSKLLSFFVAEIGAIIWL
jgi:hypothetical protein